MLEAFPSKPKGMHWRRYHRIRETHDRAADQAFGMLAMWVEKLHERI
jgi:hypothetical protein